MGAFEYFIRIVQIIILFPTLLLFNKWGATKSKIRGLKGFMIELGIFILFILVGATCILGGNYLIYKFG